MRVDRKTLRFYSKKSEEGKRLNKLSFFDPDKIEQRIKNKEQGKEKHEEYVYALQQKMTERLEAEEIKVIKTLKEKGLSKSEVDEYMDLWTELNLWPKPKNYHSSRKIMKKLNKKYNL